MNAGRILGRRHAQAVARASGEHFRRYFELGLVGMASTSLTREFLEVNDELCRILGYARQELLRTTWAELTHADDLAQELVRFDRVLAGEIDEYTLDKRWIRKDAGVIDTVTAVRCVRRADGAPECFVGLVVDITERKRVERALRASESHLAEVQALTHTGSWTWNLATHDLRWSAEEFFILGLDLERVKPSVELGLRCVHPDDRALVLRTFEGAVARRTGYSLVYRVVRPDGTVRHLDSTAHPVFNDAQELVEFVGIDVDITERVEADRALRSAFTEIKLLTSGTQALEIVRIDRLPDGLRARAGADPDTELRDPGGPFFSEVYAQHMGLPLRGQVGDAPALRLGLHALAAVEFIDSGGRTRRALGAAVGPMHEPARLTILLCRYPGAHALVCHETQEWMERFGAPGRASEPVEGPRPPAPPPPGAA